MPLFRESQGNAFLGGLCPRKPQTYFLSKTKMDACQIDAQFRGKVLNALDFIWLLHLKHCCKILNKPCSDLNLCILYSIPRIRNEQPIHTQQYQQTFFIIFYSHRGTAVAQWLRCCASIPAGVSGFFVDIKSFRSHYGPGVDSASNRNEYQEYFLGVKAVGA